MLPGAILGAVVLAGTLQALPLFVSFTSEVVALQALGTTFLLLIWLYVMANVIVFGAAFNYVLAYGLTGRRVRAEAARGADGALATEAGLGGFERARERRRGARAVGVSPLPVVAELGDRAVLAVGDEDRVEAEALRSRRRRGRSPRRASPRATTSRPSSATATMTQTYRARRSSSVGQRLEHAADRIAGRPARGQHARAPVERDRLDAGVLADRPGVQPARAPRPSAP